MGNRNRPRHQPKRKPKDKTHKQAPVSPSVYEPMQPVEVIKPRRKPRAEPESG